MLDSGSDYSVLEFELSEGEENENDDDDGDIGDPTSIKFIY